MEKNSIHYANSNEPQQEARDVITNVLLAKIAKEA